MLKLHVFGVGDGDCIVIEFPTGELGLVDSCTRGGDKESAAATFLRGKRLAFCCLTHPHRDHYGGLLRLLKSGETKADEFWYALSDLDQIIPELNTVFVPIEDPAGFYRDRVEDAGELLDLFDWVWNQPAGFERFFTGVQSRVVGPVELLLFAPDPIAWKRYRKSLLLQRLAGRPPKRGLANAISLTILIRYGEQLVWLLADLTSAALKRLPARERESVVEAARRGVKSTVIKLPHHGARNGLHSSMSEDLTRCLPQDLIVISASGDVHHPAPNVIDYWRRTGKRITATWDPDVSRTSLPLGGWASDVVSELAHSTAAFAGRDLLIEVPPLGSANVLIKQRDA